LSTSHASTPFSLLHVDIWRPCLVTSIHGHKYFLTIVDDFSRFVWVFPMTSTTETQKQLKTFVAFVER